MSENIFAADTNPVPIGRIRSYHAHVYFRDAAEREAAAIVRQQVAERFSVQLGRWHDRLVGPHALPMYQIACTPAVFPPLLSWLMLNRRGLAVLVHPNTANPRRDHLVHALWMGEMLPIVQPERLPEQASEDNEEIVPNTIPDKKLSSFT